MSFLESYQIFGKHSLNYINGKRSLKAVRNTYNDSVCFYKIVLLIMPLLIAKLINCVQQPVPIQQSEILRGSSR